MSLAREEQYADFDQLRVVDYLAVIWKSRGFLCAFSTIAVLSAFIFSLLAPKYFKSTLTLLPPTQDNTTGSSMAALMGTLQGFGLGFGSPLRATPQDIFVSILESRTIAERVSDKYQLLTYYKVDDPREAAKSLRDATTVVVSKAGVISVTVADRDPRMAAELANAHGVELNRFLQQMDVTQGSRRRRFVLDRLAETETRLKMAEEALMYFEEKNRAIALDAQAQGVIDVAAQLKGQIMASEVELEVTRNFATDSNPRVLRLKQRIEELKKQLGQLQYGKGWDLPVRDDSTAGMGGREKEIYVAAANVPKMKLQYARLRRDVKVQETVYALLMQQLEEARIAETRDAVAAEVLDAAIPALKKSSPKIALNVVLAGAVSLILGVCFVFLREYLDSLQGRSINGSNLGRVSM